MDYPAFKTFVSTFLWRDGDAVLLNALDALTRMAEASLQRDLKTQDAISTLQMTFTDPNTPIALPADYRSPDVLLGPLGDYHYVTPGHFWETTSAGGGGGPLAAGEGIFTVAGRDLHIISTKAGMPQLLWLVYYRTLPSFLDTGASWVADLHLDLFTYAVLQHAGRFVRDDDRVEGWKAAYMDALASAIGEDTGNRHARGAPQRIRFGGR
jgi:hypothetical protein